VKFKPSPYSYARENPRNFDYPAPQHGSMARSHLHQLELDAKQLREALRDDDGLPIWVNTFIATSADRLSTASDYMQHRLVEHAYGSPLAALSFLSIKELPAHGKAQTSANRGADQINTIVMHTSEGPPDRPYGPAHWFADPQSKASAHYNVYSSGLIYRSVPDKDIAWHAGNWSVNQTSIGIEIQAQADKANWNEAQLERAASLVAALAKKYGIPIDREHIVGHVEVSGPGGHYDPGPHFPWPEFMRMVKKARVKQLGIRWGLPLGLAVGGLVSIYFIEKAVGKRRGKV